MRPQFVFECAFKAMEVGCKDLQAKSKKLGKAATAITVARGGFDDINYLYSRHYSSELIRGIERAQGSNSANTALLNEAYQAVHAASGGMTTEFDRAAKYVLTVGLSSVTGYSCAFSL